VQAADEPAEIHLILNGTHAAPRVLLAGGIMEHQEQTRDDLDHEHEGQAAAPDVAPLGAAGDVLQEQRVDELAITGARVEPVTEPANHGESFTRFGARSAGYPCWCCGLGWRIV